MIIKNSMDLPQAFINAVSLEKHNAEGEFSATTLLKGACETILTDRHFDEIEVDVADCVWQIFGTAVHSIFEKSGIDGFREEKFSIPVSNSIVTGKVDLYDMENETLYDWKTASIWKATYKDFDDWKKQGLIYAWLMKKNGLSVKKIKFIALLKDHSKSKSRMDTDYPQKPVYRYEFDVTENDLAEIEKFIIAKVQDLEAESKLADWEIKPCSDEERWATADKWAIMKAGRKTALKVCESEEQAKELMESLGGTSIEYRKGESKKCEDYCNCKAFCPFYNNCHK